jgi:hypothetical protein
MNMSHWLLLFFALIVLDFVLAAGYVLYTFYIIHRNDY